MQAKEEQAGEAIECTVRIVDGTGRCDDEKTGHSGQWESTSYTTHIEESSMVEIEPEDKAEGAQGKGDSADGTREDGDTGKGKGLQRKLRGTA